MTGTRALAHEIGGAPVHCCDDRKAGGHMPYLYGPAAHTFDPEPETACNPLLR
ncbi:hypothetical protein [Aurantiacibacter marinus]|uniref:hypothetical protein n=1 Tax=Aurantiacibacter marinus TaxID=874156 RepID=UPI000A56B98F|nr:hypothetical protein [Aurantiacibacter marinus]